MSEGGGGGGGGSILWKGPEWYNVELINFWWCKTTNVIKTVLWLGSVAGNAPEPLKLAFYQPRFYIHYCPL